MPKIRIHSRKKLGPLSLAYALRNIIDRKSLLHTNNNPFSLPFSSRTYFLQFVGATSTNFLMIKLQPKIYDYIMLTVRISFIPLINRRLFSNSEILRLQLLKNKSLGIVIQFKLFWLGERKFTTLLKIQFQGKLQPSRYRNLLLFLTFN